ncbi:DUF3301 domain-containing protein [Halomonadaceae bacterium KBTZ08]
MQIGLKTLTLLFAIGFGAWYWWRALGTKELALQVARRACERADVDLLDQSVCLSGLGVQRDRQGRLRLRRTFSFDFTATGEGRYRGRLVLLGQRTESVAFEPHRF